MKLATAAVLATLLTSTPVLAEDDYTVDFGAETKAGREVGTLHCRLSEFCDAKMPSLGLRISLDVSRSDHSDAHVYLYLHGNDSGCCYFAEARDRLRIDPRQPLLRVPLFKGAHARGDLYIENEPAGTLYLRFQFRQDDNHKSKVTRPPTWQLSNEDLYRRQIPGSPR